MGYLCWFLLVLITLKEIVFKEKEANFLTLLFLFFIVLFLPSLIMDRSHIFSSELQDILFSFSFIWGYFDIVIKFCFLKGT